VGSTFSNWSGCTSSSGKTCNVTLNASKTIIATFTSTTVTNYALQVSRTGNGSGTVTATGINCGSDCSESYASGTSVKLTAAANSGSTFASWSGCTTSSSNTCNVTMSASKTVTAAFNSTSPTERLNNGSYSSGLTSWSRSGDFWAGTNLSNYRTAPGYAAGGVDPAGQPKNSAAGSMYQGFQIPANSSSATLSVWLNVTSEETTTMSKYDTLKVTLQSTSGTVLATVCTRSNLDKRSSVKDYSSCTLNVLPYKGQSVRVHFAASTDGSLRTTFRIDDVSAMINGN
jgi:hypothetical protein